MDFKQDYWTMFKELLGFLIDNSVKKEQICYTQATVNLIH